MDPVGARRLGILHLDMDCFFAAVEVLRDPSLGGRPVVVGGTGPRGVVASASYEARVFGVRSAMPMATARRLCPAAVFLPGRFEAYAEVSRSLRAILESVTPLVEPIALDEAYLDVTGAARLLGSGPTIAAKLRSSVREELLLDCSVGVARSKLLAKLASEAAKPVAGPSGITPGAGVVVVGEADEIEFLHRHVVRALPGVGPRTAERLARFGVSTVGDLAAVNVDSLVRLLGSAAGRELHELAWARDARPVVADRETRSIGHEETFPADLHDITELRRRARRSAGSVAARCRASEVVARTITLKVRFADFSTVTRSRTVARPVATGGEVGDVACDLLDAIALTQGVRLLGVLASGLSPAEVAGSHQLSLFAEESDFGRGRRDEVELAAEEVRRRYGESALAPLGLDARRGPRPGPAGPTEPE